MNKSFLPISLEEGKSYYKDFSQFDVVFVTGDPYYDHPLSGMAIISRLMDKKGYNVGVIAQPLSDEDYKVCGRPKYFFCITSGLLDSMLANYTPMLKPRENILVPERALMVYTQKVKEHFKGQFGRLREVILGPDNLLYITTSNRDGRGSPHAGDDKVIKINPKKL